MEIKSTEESRADVAEFTKRLLNLMLEKKKIDADIKQLKKDWAEEGVSSGVVAKVINKIKALKKKSADEIFEEDTLQEWLESDADIDDKIGQLND